MTCSPPFRRVTGLPEDILRRPRQRRWIKGDRGVGAPARRSVFGGLESHCQNRAKEQPASTGPLWKSDRKRENIEEAGVVPEGVPR